MLNLIEQPINSCHLQALSLAILDAEMKQSRRLKFQIFAFKMSIYLGNVQEEIEHHMFNHFCERFLPVTFRTWLKKL